MKTAKLKVVRPPKKKFSWVEELGKLEANGEPLRALPEDRPAIAPLLSREMKLKYPGRAYKTDMKTEPGFFLVHRTA